MPNPYDIQQERIKKLLEVAPPEMLEDIKEMGRNQMAAYSQMFGAPEDHLHDLNDGLPIIVAPCSDEFDEFVMPQENVFSIAGGGVRAEIGAAAGIVREPIEKFKPEIKGEWPNMDNNIHVIRKPVEMEIGKRYLIETKKGQVKKYLSFIDERTNTYYFVEKKDKVNSSNIGYMFAARGTAHAIQNVVAEVE